MGPHSASGAGRKVLGNQPPTPNNAELKEQHFYVNNWDLNRVLDLAAVELPCVCQATEEMKRRIEAKEREKATYIQAKRPPENELGEIIPPMLSTTSPLRVHHQRFQLSPPEIRSMILPSPSNPILPSQSNPILPSTSRLGFEHQYLCSSTYFLHLCTVS